MDLTIDNPNPIDSFEAVSFLKRSNKFSEEIVRGLPVLEIIN